MTHRGGRCLAWGAATAARLTTITARAYDPIGFAPTVTIDFGDGSTTDSYREFYPGYKPCRGGGGEAKLDFTHAYRVPGTCTVTATLQRCTGRPDEVVQAEPVRITVDPPPDDVLSSNGTRQPRIGANRDVEGRTVRLSVAAGDRDGYVRITRINWGDGSPPTKLERPLSECRDTPYSYPEEGGYPSSAVEHQQSVVEHTYAVPGTYRLSVTVESTGCDGGSVQTAEDPQNKEVTVS